MSGTLFNRLATELGAFLYPLDRAATTPGALESMLLELGAVPDTDTANLAEALQGIVAAKRAIDALGETATPSFSAIAELLESSRQVVAAIDAITEGDDALNQLGGFGRDLGELLASAWLTALHPVVHQVMVLLTLIELSSDQPFAPVVLNGPTPVRLPYRIDRLHLDRLMDLLRDPAEVLQAEYAGDAMADKLFPRVAGLLQVLGIPCRYGIHPRDAAALGDSAPLLARSLIVYLDHPLNVSTATESGAMFSFTPDLGLIMSPFGSLATTRTAGPFTVALQVGAGAPAVAYGRNGLTLLGSASGFTGRLEAANAGQPFIIGSPAGTRLELANVKLSAQTSLSAARRVLELAADTDAKLVVAPADGDSFLASILPRDGLHAELSAGLTWSNERGLTFRGSAGLDATFPVDLTFAGVGLTAVHLGLHARDGAIDAEISAGLKAAIGPVEVAIDGVGVRATLTFGEGGNLGGADLDVALPRAHGARPGDRRRPGHRVRLAALRPRPGPVRGRRAPAVRGHRGARHRAADDRRRPASRCWCIVSADFPPMQLGMGFMLVGVGGLLGINRTVAVEALRAGLKTGALGAVLSPPDPKASAGQLVASLARLFPPAPGRHVFAPTARIVWGSPTLITIELALALELPSPVRLVVARPAAGAAARRARADRAPAGRRAGRDRLRPRRGRRRRDAGGLAARAVRAHGRHGAADELGRAAVVPARRRRLPPALRRPARLPGAGPRRGRAGQRRQPEAAARGLPRADVEHGAVRRARGPCRAGRELQHRRLPVVRRAGDARAAGVRRRHRRQARGQGRQPHAVLDLAGAHAERPAPVAGARPGVVLDPVLRRLVRVRRHDRRRRRRPRCPRRSTSRRSCWPRSPTRAPGPRSCPAARTWSRCARWSRAPPSSPTRWRRCRSASGSRRWSARSSASGRACPAAPSASGSRSRRSAASAPRSPPLQDHFAPAQFSALSDDAKLSAPSFEAMTSGAALGADGFVTGTGVTVAIEHEQLIVHRRRHRRAEVRARADPRRRVRGADRDGARAAARLHDQER